MENKLEEMTLEELLFIAQPDIREIVFHSDGSVMAKTGGRAPKPKKLYTAYPPYQTLTTYGELAKKAVIKLIKENHPSYGEAANNNTIEGAPSGIYTDSYRARRTRH